MALSGKDTENGRLYLSDKTANYLKRKSRAALEKYHNAPILFFAIDWEQSKKNFYGEMTSKKFVDPKGVPVRGMYKITDNPDSLENGIPNKSLNITVVLYVEQLEELNIDPQQGDYFAIGKRFYHIYSRSISDVGPGSFMMNRAKMTKSFFCYEEDDQSIQKNAFLDNLGQESQINPKTDLI